jgi:hypothetical protein
MSVMKDQSKTITNIFLYLALQKERMKFYWI